MEVGRAEEEVEVVPADLERRLVRLARVLEAAELGERRRADWSAPIERGDARSASSARASASSNRPSSNASPAASTSASPGSGRAGASQRSSRRRVMNAGVTVDRALVKRARPPRGVRHRRTAFTVSTTGGGAREPA